MIADAAVDENVVMRRTDNVALDTEHEFASYRIDIPGLQPAFILVEQFGRQAGKEKERIEDCLFELDDAMDGRIPDRELCDHFFLPTSGNQRVGRTLAEPPDEGEA
jgi:hypothetical protein